MRNVYLVEIGPISLGDASQDIRKDKECNLGPVVGLLKLKLSRVKLYFPFACMFTFEGNIQCIKEGTCTTSGVSHGMH